MVRNYTPQASKKPLPEDYVPISPTIVEPETVKSLRPKKIQTRKSKDSHIGKSLRRS